MVIRRFLQRRRASTAVALFAAGACLLGGCATTSVNAEWTDPQFAGRSLRGQLVLVLCDANDTAVRRICEDRLAASLTASGVTPVRGDGDLTLGPPPANDRTIAAARKANAKAIFGARVGPKMRRMINPGPSVSFGLGGFSGSRGGVSGGGVGVENAGPRGECRHRLRGRSHTHRCRDSSADVGGQGLLARVGERQRADERARAGGRRGCRAGRLLLSDARTPDQPAALAACRQPGERALHRLDAAR